MAARVTSVFLYVKDVRRSLDFYNEVVGAEVLQVHAEHEGAPFSLAILRLDDFTLMIHPQERTRKSSPTRGWEWEFISRSRSTTSTSSTSTAWTRGRF